MRKSKSTVLLVDATNNETKTVQIPTKILLHWKKYLLITILSIVSIGTLMSFIGYRYAGSYYQTKYEAKIQNIHQRSSQQLDDLNKEKLSTDQVRQSFESIDKTFERINKFLKGRGLKPMKTENAGGPATLEDSEISEAASYYKKDVLAMEKLLKNTPVGKPHEGRQTSSFGVRSNPFGNGGVEGHPGIDFAGKTGDPISVTANGIVIFAGPRGGYGNCVIVQHTHNLQTLYGHMSKVKVKVGQKVTSGETVGLLGSTGRSTGPHIHYEVIKNGQKTNPKDYLNL